jgi:hypothetical protein
MTKKFIFIPVVNNFHLLEKAINSVSDNIFDKYFIFNNSNSKLTIDTKHFEVINNGCRLSFTDTQNAMREYAISNNYDYYCFMHNDGEIVDDTAERLIQMADELINAKTKWSVIFTNYDVFCAYSTECVKNIGIWGDKLWNKEQQSGYYLDNDYYRRMKLSIFKLMQLENANVLHNEHSNTIKDPNELMNWNNQQSSVQKHYIAKWGGLPGCETFDTPFNKFPQKIASSLNLKRLKFI